MTSANAYELSLAVVSSLSGARPAARRGLYLDFAPQAQIRRAFFLPVPDPRGAAQTFPLAAARALCPLSAGPRRPDHRHRPARGRGRGAAQPHDDHPGAGRLPQHVRHGCGPKPADGGPGSRAGLYRGPGGRDPDRHGRLCRLCRNGCPADQRQRAAQISDREPDHVDRHGHRQRDAEIDRRHRRDERGRCAQRRQPGPRRAASRQGRITNRTSSSC